MSNIDSTNFSDIARNAQEAIKNHTQSKEEFEKLKQELLKEISEKLDAVAKQHNAREIIINSIDVNISVKPYKSATKIYVNVTTPREDLSVIKEGNIKRGGYNPEPTLPRPSTKIQGLGE